jgi:hypothetical protein
LEAAMEKYWNVSNLVTSVSNKICERWTKMGNVTIGSNIKNEGNYSIWENYLELWYKSDNPIKSIEILVNGNINQTVDTWWKKEWIYYWSLNIPWMYKNQKLIIEIRAVDDEYYSTSEVKQIFVWSRDETAPIISLINPIDNSIKLYDTDYFNLRANIEDSSKIEVIVYINWIEYKNLWNMRKLELPINEEKNLIAWIYEIKIEAKDIQWNTSESIINLEIMKK